MPSKMENGNVKLTPLVFRFILCLFLPRTRYQETWTTSAATSASACSICGIPVTSFYVLVRLDCTARYPLDRQRYWEHDLRHGCLHFVSTNLDSQQYRC